MNLRMRVHGLKNQRAQILFYDGECGLCHWCVQWILENQNANHILLSPLQSEFAFYFFEAYSRTRPSLSEVVFFDGHTTSGGAPAVLKLAQILFPKFSILFKLTEVLVPSFILHSLYKLVASQRFKLVAPACHLPSPQSRARFMNTLESDRS